MNDLIHIKTQNPEYMIPKNLLHEQQGTAIFNRKTLWFKNSGIISFPNDLLIKSSYIHPQNFLTQLQCKKRWVAINSKVAIRRLTDRPDTDWKDLKDWNETMTKNNKLTTCAAWNIFDFEWVICVYLNVLAQIFKTVKRTGILESKTSEVCI